MRAVLVRSLLVLEGLLLALLAVASLVAVVDGSSAGSRRPAIGLDHWHAVYEIVICGQRQPPLPQWLGGVHTHSDGIIHIHPFIPQEEGRGARLVKWFEYGRGKLTGDEMRLPGSARTFANGDRCPDGSTGSLRVIVNGEPLARWDDYIPADGDRIVIVFGPPE